MSVDGRHVATLSEMDLLIDVTTAQRTQNVKFLLALPIIEMKPPRGIER